MLPGRTAPVTTVGVLGWLRANLCSNWLNTTLTVAALLLLWRIVPPLLGWALFEADFTGVTGEECTGRAPAGRGSTNAFPSSCTASTPPIHTGESTSP